jgi:hypothetical protein
MNGERPDRENVSCAGASELYSLGERQVWLYSKPPNRASGVAQIWNLPYRGVALRSGSTDAKAPGTDPSLAEYNSAIQQFTKLRYE